MLSFMKRHFRSKEKKKSEKKNPNLDEHQIELRIPSQVGQVVPPVKPLGTLSSGVLERATLSAALVQNLHAASKSLKETGKPKIQIPGPSSVIPVPLRYKIKKHPKSSAPSTNNNEGDSVHKDEGSDERDHEKMIAKSKKKNMFSFLGCCFGSIRKKCCPRARPSFQGPDPLDQIRDNSNFDLLAASKLLKGTRKVVKFKIQTSDRDSVFPVNPGPPPSCKSSSPSTPSEKEDRVLEAEGSKKKDGEQIPSEPKNITPSPVVKELLPTPDSLELSSPEVPGTNKLSLPDVPGTNKLSLPDVPGTNELSSPEVPETNELSSPEFPGTNELSSPEVSGTNEQKAIGAIKLKSCLKRPMGIKMPENGVQEEVSSMHAPPAPPPSRIEAYDPKFVSILGHMAKLPLEPFYREDVTRDYKHVSKLGKGCFGIVKKVQNIRSKEYFALKIIKCTTPYAVIVSNEISLLDRSSGHPLLLRFINAYKHDFKNGKLEFGILTEVFDGRNLHQYRIRNPLKQKDVKHILQQLGEAVKYIHQLGIIHCDVKPENILINTSMAIKLIDFGLSQKGPVSKRQCGTRCFSAPEIGHGKNKCFRRKRYGYAVDYYSVGALLHDLLYGRPPPEMKAHLCAIERVVQFTFGLVTKKRGKWYAENITKEDVVFMAKLLNICPEARPNDNTFLTDVYFNG